MKKSIAATVVGAAILVTATPAAAQHKKDGLYLRLDGGYSASRDANGDLGEDVGQAAVLGGGIGYRINEYLRTDLTVAYRGGYEINYTDRSLIPGTALGAKGDVSNLSGFLNLYADIDRWGPIFPYLGIGIGISRNKVDDVTMSLGGTGVGQIDGASKTVPAWQMMAGFSLAFTYSAFLDVGYHYVDLGEAETADNGTALGVPVTGARSRGNLRAHEIQIGVRWQF
jgi:opacity protein-like surface antigen